MIPAFAYKKMGDPIFETYLPIVSAKRIEQFAMER